MPGRVGLTAGHTAGIGARKPRRRCWSCMSRQQRSPLRRDTPSGYALGLGRAFQRGGVTTCKQRCCRHEPSVLSARGGYRQPVQRSCQQDDGSNRRGRCICGQRVIGHCGVQSLHRQIGRFMEVPLPLGLEVLVRGLGVHRAVMSHAPEVFKYQHGRVGPGLRSVSVKRSQQRDQRACQSEECDCHEHATDHQHLAA